MPLTPTEKQRRYRARTRRGEAVVLVSIRSPVVAALLVSGRLTAEQATDRELVGSAISEVLDWWAKEWQDRA